MTETDLEKWQKRIQKISDAESSEGTTKTHKLSQSSAAITDSQKDEIGGPQGPEPTRFGDWERNGLCSDF